MKNYCKFLPLALVIATTIGLAGCKTGGTKLSKKQFATEARSIQQVLTDQASAWNRGDLKSFMIGYHHSPKLRFASNNSVFQGWQGAYDSYTKAFTDKAKMSKLTFSQMDIQLLSGDSAMVFGRFTNTFTDGRKPKTGLFTLIMKKMPQGWRIVHDHSSDAADKEKE
jgi:ketosteroid isomerase-like protein